MPTLIPVVEGDGEREAVPLLLRRILTHNEHWTWQVGQARVIGGIGTLTKRYDNVLQRLVLDSACDAILILNDLDDGCPMQEAQALARRAEQLQLPCPVAVVLAHREYEAWFLASLATIAGNYDLPADTRYPGGCEDLRGAKGWLSKQMPPGKIYKETIHQVKMTQLLDIDLARATSRSFRRLCRAVDELIAATGTDQRGVATPVPAPPMIPPPRGRP